MAGIVSYSGYVPRYRLNRMAIFKAMGWFNPANLAYARGEKAVANYDEDSITMATAAAMDCLKGLDRSDIDGLYFASTTMPYKERLNAGIISAALNLEESARAADFSSAIKAGTTALLAALESVGSKNAKKVMVCAADSRLGKAGGMQEMAFGDGGAAILVGDEDVVAEFKGSYSITCDFVDHYRGDLAKFDRTWEERWIRDEGYDKLIPAAVKGLADRYGIKLSDVAKVIYPCVYAAEHQKIAKILGLKPEAVVSPLLDEVGDTGAAHPLLMLAKALDEARIGDQVIVVSFGNGCDALWFQVKGSLAPHKERKGVSGFLANKAELTSYEKYTVFRSIIPVEIGGRGEQDMPTLFSVLWRNRKAVLGLTGSRCKKCGTPQFPPQRICVNPECRAIKQMEDYHFSSRAGKVFNYTGDMLAFSYDPPEIYGTVEFEGGGRYLFNFTDCDLKSVQVGMPVEMSFRKKMYDEKRGIHGYFWKAVPRKEVA